MVFNELGTQKFSQLNTSTVYQFVTEIIIYYLQVDSLLPFLMLAIDTHAFTYIPVQHCYIPRKEKNVETFDKIPKGTIVNKGF
jgi:hypothetical protein